MCYCGVVKAAQMSRAKWVVGVAAAITALATIGYASPPRTSKPVATTVTMLAEHPGDFMGKWVSVKSQVIFGRGPLILTEGDYRILISEPGSSEVGKGPFDLIRDANWQKLKEAVAPVPPPARGGKIMAVVEGRFDSKAASWWRRLFHIQGGYGHLGLYAHRLVIHRVTSVEVVPNP
jgi:hypothetical protein